MRKCVIESQFSKYGKYVTSEVVKSCVLASFSETDFAKFLISSNLFQRPNNNIWSNLQVIKMLHILPQIQKKKNASQLAHGVNVSFFPINLMHDGFWFPRASQYNLKLSGKEFPFQYSQAYGKS